MKAVLTFAMKAKSRQLQNRVSKTAAILESLAKQQVDANDVAERIKAGGGIEAMYRALSPNRNTAPCLLDDHEILNPALAEDDEEENRRRRRDLGGDAVGLGQSVERGRRLGPGRGSGGRRPQIARDEACRERRNRGHWRPCGTWPGACRARCGAGALS